MARRALHEYEGKRSYLELAPKYLDDIGDGVVGQKQMVILAARPGQGHYIVTRVGLLPGGGLKCFLVEDRPIFATQIPLATTESFLSQFCLKQHAPLTSMLAPTLSLV
ncbi:hypothetical protein GCM10022236_42800 [Microlunatus ginsengisoli]|uniref:Uncharacterized protein n=1 Tax=Microlunatus ginsengisoli TaxID=363863 RepID=A0ABP7ALW6_9ACTN